MIRIDRLDHLVLTVADIDRSCAFYRDILGFEVVTFGEGQGAEIRAPEIQPASARA